MPEKTQLFDFRIRITVFSNKVGIANCFKCVEKIFKKLYFFDSSITVVRELEHFVTVGSAF